MCILLHFNYFYISYIWKKLQISENIEKMMNISPIVNSVKCTVFGCFVQFWYVLDGSTAKTLLDIVQNPKSGLPHIKYTVLLRTN